MFTVKQTTPLFCIFDEAKAKEFYLDYLGFQLDWEHRYEPGMPLYVQVTLGDATIHLTEHHGDCSPGAAVRIEVAGVEALHRALLAKP